jgi:hypothetical protein
LEKTGLNWATYAFAFSFAKKFSGTRRACAERLGFLKLDPLRLRDETTMGASSKC